MANESSCEELERKVRELEKEVVKLRQEKDSLRESETNYRLLFAAESEETLKKVSDDLEKQVQERTAELLRANDQLGCEIEQRKRAEETLHWQKECLLAVHETYLGLANRLDLKELLKTILERAASLAGTEHGFILLLDPDQDEMEMRVGLGVHSNVMGYRFKHDQGVAGMVWQSGEPLIVSDYGTWAHRLPMKALDSLSCVLGIPLKSGGKVVGVIGLSQLEDGKGFSEEDVFLLSHLAELATIALDNAKLYDDLRRELDERRQAEESLRASEAQKKAILDGSVDRIRLVDRDFRILWANKTTTRELGLTPEEITGRLCYEVNAGMNAPCPNCPANAALESGEIERSVVHRLNAPGTTGETYWEHHAVPIKNESGDIVHVIQIARDITERKIAEVERGKLERQLVQAQKMESIGTLAGGIAHDFNNILSAIIGYTELAIEDIARDNPGQSHLKEVFKAGRRAKDLVKQILTFSRQSERERGPVDVSVLVKETLRLIRSTLPASIEIRQSIDSSSAILADPTEIHQVMMNLCTNAHQAMGEEGGILEISLSEVTLDCDPVSETLKLEPGRYIRLSVADNGCGMDDWVVERIFDLYFTTKPKGDGTGLGLSVVHGIVNSLGGAISAYSEKKKGSSFHVYLPALGKEKTVEIRLPEEIPKGNGRILFVDDEAPIMNLGRQMLERLGYEVDARSSSVEALELFRTKPDSFDLVMTDMAMPNMTGIHLAKELRDIRPDIPVILCTGFSGNITEENAKAKGIRAVVMKPILKSEMAAAIRNVLDQKAS